MRRTRTNGRRGFTLIELAIVVGIFGLMAGIASTMLNDALPRWRTRRAAMELVANLEMARLRAGGDGVQYRVGDFGYDSDLADVSVNAGSYTIAKGNRSISSSSWDLLPADMSGDTPDDTEGTINIATGESHGLPKVSLEEPAYDLNEIIFSPRGFVDNPDSDFVAGNGYITLSFINKAAYAEGIVERWTVFISRGGDIKLESDKSLWVTGSGSTGYAGNSTYTSGAGGFALGASASEEAE